MLNPIKVFMPKQVLKRWEDDCKRAFPLEYFGLLLGESDDENVMVAGIWTPDNWTRYSGTDHVVCDDMWIMDGHEYAKEENCEIVGWAHSHPYRDPSLFRSDSPSRNDFKLFTWNKIAMISTLLAFDRKHNGGCIEVKKIKTRVYPPLRRTELVVVDCSGIVELSVE